jgi:SPP1 gp7 family putative phage head morphogenesis protein
MDNREYWAKRQTNRRLVTGERLALETSVDVVKVYHSALRKINSDINEVYRKYSEKTGLDVSELSQILTGSERKDFLVNIQKRMFELGFQVEDIYQPNYISRITRLEALKERIYWELVNVNVEEERILNRSFKGVIVQSYDEIMEDYLGDRYPRGAFTSVNRGVVDELLRERWSGRNYSERIWGDPASDTWRRLARDIPDMVGSSLVMGRSYSRTAQEVRESFGVEEYQALRLVRTESAYFSGQAELEAMRDLGIKEYEYYAIMDRRTSTICRDLDGEVFLYEEAEAGKNYPPMHPNCRSRAMPVIDEARFERERPIYIKEMEASVQVEVFNSDVLYPQDFESAYEYIGKKLGTEVLAQRGEWNESQSGRYALVLGETDGRVNLDAILTELRGTGLGTNIMNMLKEYSDSKAKLLVVNDVKNPDFFRKFKWLEEKESLNVFMYAPQEEDIRKMVMRDVPIKRGSEGQ